VLSKLNAFMWQCQIRQEVRSFNVSTVVYSAHAICTVSPLIQFSAKLLVGTKFSVFFGLFFFLANFDIYIVLCRLLDARKSLYWKIRRICMGTAK
jgi:hypothetical protein